MDRPTCKTCPYWDAPGSKETNGFCRRYPPSVLVYQEKLIDMSPTRLPDQWCGEHPSFPAYIASLKTDALSPVDHLSMTLKRLDSESLDKALTLLRTVRSREVIKLYLGLYPGCNSYDAQEIARIFKLTKARTMQIIDKAIVVLQVAFPQARS